MNAPMYMGMYGIRMSHRDSKAGTLPRTSRWAYPPSLATGCGRKRLSPGGLGRSFWLRFT